MSTSNLGQRLAELILRYRWPVLLCTFAFVFWAARTANCRELNKVKCLDLRLTGMSFGVMSLA